MFPLSKPPPVPESESSVATRVLTADEQRAADRTLNLIELGFSMDQILRMQVGRRFFDWHKAERLLKRGQTHEQVTFRLEE